VKKEAESTEIAAREVEEISGPGAQARYTTRTVNITPKIVYKAR